MAVYTELSTDEIKDFLTAYRLPPLKAAQGIKSGIENTNYLLTMDDGGRYIFTLFEKRVSDADFPFFITLMEQLAKGGLTCPCPVYATDGQALRHLKGKPALIVTFLQGKAVTSFNEVHMQELGAHVARMHRLANNVTLTRRNTVGIESWKDMFAAVVSRVDEIVPGLAHEMTNELQVLSNSWPKDLPRGLIHGDVFPDNVFYDGESKLTGIIDFYFSCDEIRAYEMAICLNAWCFDADMTFNGDHARHMLQHYQQVYPLGGAELEALPILARGAAMRFLLTRAYDWLYPVKDALVTPKDPMEYVKKLRFHRSVTHYSQYGV
jgi:homoserine kinase type II